MEAIVQPRVWPDFPAGRDELFRSLRSPTGKHMALDDNFFVETIVPKSVNRTLSDEDMNAYRAPFQTREARLPTLVWPRELPVVGEPADVTSIVEAYGAWLAKSNIPKLFVAAEPGALITARARAFCRTWPNQREVIRRAVSGFENLARRTSSPPPAATSSMWSNASFRISGEKRRSACRTGTMRRIRRGPAPR
jgi:haloalkane dehalogenase